MLCFIEGEFQTVLPVYLHVCHDDMEWFSLNHEKIFDEVTSILVTNYEFIKGKSIVENRDDSFYTLPRGEYVIVQFMSSKTPNSSKYSILFSDDSQSLSSTSIESFQIHTWIKPVDKSLSVLESFDSS
jgi:hypothetical protein